MLNALEGSNDPFEDIPWPSKLVHEYATGVDTDNNGLIYGHDFVFSQTLQTHPVMLKTVAEHLEDFRGKNLSFIEYARSLKSGSKDQSDVLNYIDKITDV